MDLRRRQYLAASAGIGIGTLGGLSGDRPHVRSQTGRYIEIDRTVGDLLVVPPESRVPVSGSTSLDQYSTLAVVLSTGTESPLLIREEVEVFEDNTWTAWFDLSATEPGQRFVISVENEGTVATAPGVIGTVTGAISFPDQEAMDGGRVISIPEAYLEIGGFVVIYEERLSGPIVGVSEYLTGGMVHSAVGVSLDVPLEGERTLLAAAHIDSDVDHEFGFTENRGLDPPYWAVGDPVYDEAVVAGPVPTQIVTTTTPEPTTTTRPRTTTQLTTARRTPPPGMTTLEGPDSDGPLVDIPGLDVGVGGTGGLFGVWLLQRARGRPGLGRAETPPAEAANESEEAEDTNDHENRPPRAQIISLPQNPRPGRPVLFDGALSVDPDAGDHVDTYTWAIGERSPTGKRVVHVFGEPGEVAVTLTVTDTHGAVGTATETVAVQETGGRLTLQEAHPDAGGRDQANLSDEYLTFRNAGDAKLALDGWTVHDAAEEAGRVAKGDHTFTFPEGVTLEPEATVTIHTGPVPRSLPPDSVTDRHLSWKKHWPVWNNDGDVIVVTDDVGHPVLATRYERTGGGAYVFEDLSPTDLLDWFPPVTLHTGDTASLRRVSLAPTYEPAALSNAVEFVAGALFLRGSKQFVSSWALLTSFFLISVLTWVVAAVVGPLSQTVPVGLPVMLVLGSLGVTLAGALIDVVQHGLGSAIDRAD